MNIRQLILATIAFSAIFCFSCKKDKPVNAGSIQISTCKIGSEVLKFPDKTTGIVNDADVIITFSAPLDTNSAKGNIVIQRGDNTGVAVKFSFTDNNSTVVINPDEPFDNLTDYKLKITSSLSGSKGESFAGIEYSFTSAAGAFAIKTITINNQNFMPPVKGKNIALTNLNILVEFTAAPDTNNLKSYFRLAGNPVFETTMSGTANTVQLHYPATLSGYTTYYFSVSSELKAKNGNTFAGFSNSFFTALDSTLKFPLITDDELLTLIQARTFRYFYDFAHPVCGLARDRNSSNNEVTTGGSGFGVMALIVGMDRGFITRNEGLTRLDKMLGFLETCDRFHGAWPHWINGNTGKVIPFSTKDNGGDLVETAFLMQGLITMRQYLSPNVQQE
ncbi:MAG: Ig-like domain-containing protein [Bacteroidota bacterium]